MRRRLETMDGEQLPRSTGGGGYCERMNSKNEVWKYRWGRKKGTRRARRRADKALEKETTQ